MASIRKRKWFTPTQRKSIDPLAKQLAGPAWDIKKTRDGGLSAQQRGEFINVAAESLGIQPEECWIVAYKDRDGRAFKQFPTKAAAVDFQTNTLHEIKLGTHTRASSSKTVAEAWELWLDYCKAEKLEFYTIEQRKQHLNLHVKPFIGSVKLSDLKTTMVYDFDRSLRDGGRSLSMRRKVITNLKTMLTYAEGHCPPGGSSAMVAQNAARGVKVKKDDRDGPPVKLRAGEDFPSIPELNQIIEGAKGRWRPFIVTAIFTGMRASELRGLPWSNVDLDAGVIYVRQRADKGGTIGPPKSKAGKRDIPLPPIVVNVLRKWRDECPKGELGLVFPNGSGNVESHSNIYERFWQPLQIKLGLVRPAVDDEDKPILDGDGNQVMTHRYGFHRLRHAAASLFIKYLGWQPSRIKDVMGHSSITITFDLYGHLFEDIEADRAKMEKIEAAIKVA